MTWLWVAWARADDVHVAERMLEELSRRRYGPAADDATTARICPRCASSTHGRPVLRGVEVADRPVVSIARTAGVTAVALGAGSSVGIDVERTDAFTALSVEDVLLNPAERATTPGEVALSWVRKEALLKACGEGLRVDPASVRLDDSAGGPVVVEWPAPHPQPDWVCDIVLASDLTAAVAGHGDEPTDISVYAAARGGVLDHVARRVRS